MRHVLLSLIAFAMWSALFLTAGVPYALVLVGIGVVAVVLVWQVGRGLDIHPALVIVGVLAGGEIAGVAGMFLSVPVFAAARIVWRRLQAPASAHETKAQLARSSVKTTLME